MSQRAIENPVQGIKGFPSSFMASDFETTVDTYPIFWICQNWVFKYGYRKALVLNAIKMAADFALEEANDLRGTYGLSLIDNAYIHIEKAWLEAMSFHSVKHELTKAVRELQEEGAISVIRHNFGPLETGMRSFYRLNISATDKSFEFAANIARALGNLDEGYFLSRIINPTGLLRNENGISYVKDYDLEGGSKYYRNNVVSSLFEKGLVQENENKLIFPNMEKINKLKESYEHKKNLFEAYNQNKKVFSSFLWESTYMTLCRYNPFFTGLTQDLSFCLYPLDENNMAIVPAKNDGSILLGVQLWRAHGQTKVPI
jgi:hypothetical protein